MSPTEARALQDVVATSGCCGKMRNFSKVGGKAADSVYCCHPAARYKELGNDA